MNTAVSQSRSPKTSPRTQRKRFAAVGAGGRLANFTHELVRSHPDDAEFVGLCDVSQIRMDAHNSQLLQLGYPIVPTYSAAEFRRMLRETRADAVLITTVDSAHDLYIIATLEEGVEVITEKPLTVNADKLTAIANAVERTGGSCRVAFNYRWVNWNSKVKELLDQGVIGAVRNVHFEYLLDTRHGADYYRRWHSRMENSGGLLVHKSTHHFDLVNWWLDCVPEQVFAYGDLMFYGRKNAIARGDERLTRYARYTGTKEAATDPFALDLTSDPRLRALYHDAEQETGYLRDRNVFGDHIDIYDTMSVNVRYRNRALLTYTLVSYSAREGMSVSFNGDRGRIELWELGDSHLICGQDQESVSSKQLPGTQGIRVFPHFADPYDVQPDPGPEGGHWGSDVLLGEQIFSAKPAPDSLNRNAGYEQGAASVLVGFAANASIKQNRPVSITEQFPLRPDATKLSQLA